MARPLPSLNALRVFEAAARHLSFLKASEELHVTPGAVSQQIRALEDELGVKLFRRFTRGVLLTDPGQRYARKISQLFDGLTAATRELRRDSPSAELKVSTVASFAARWLIPRLGAFRRAHPKFALSVEADDSVTDFAVDDIDLAIRYGPGGWPDLISELLFREEIFPVCSPKLLEGPVPLKTVADLSRHTLLDEETAETYSDRIWDFWFDSVGADSENRPKPGLRFTYAHMALQAAVAGQGVALGSTVLAADDLALGNLVRPLAESTMSRYAYWFVCPPDAADRPKVKAFREWVTAEAKRFVGQNTGT
ncbi:MAG TPA: transcriptional regulator GcvA [Caulobacteraceae bacterium]|nr:transcriptional regulator GcvA [Caulobacteraceae bacterium]